MTHSKQAAKRVRTSEKARVRNKAARSALRSALKTAIKTGGTPAGDASLRLALKRADKAAKAGAIHRNTAARRKSRLMRALNKQKAGAATPA